MRKRENKQQQAGEGFKAHGRPQMATMATWGSSSAGAIQRDRTIKLPVVKIYHQAFKKTVIMEVDCRRFEQIEEWKDLEPFGGERMLIAESADACKFILWNSEGIGIWGTKDEGVKIPLFGYRTKEDGSRVASGFAVVDMYYDWEEIQKKLTGETEDFATFVRTFGDRLEFNYTTALQSMENRIGLRMVER